MDRSSQDSSSTRASHNSRIRRGHNSENRRTSHRTEHSHSPVRRRIRRSGYPSQISFHFTVCFMPTHAARPQYLRTSVEGTGVRNSEYSSPGNNPQPSLSFRYVPFTHVNEFTGVQTPAAGRGSSVAEYHQHTQNAGHNIGPAPSLHTDVAGPEHPRIPRDWHYPQPSGGLYNGGFTSGDQTNAVWPGSFTGGYNPGEPRASLIPGVQTPAVGLGPARSSGVGYNQPTPNATLGFGGQTLQAPLFPEYDTQAAAPHAVGLGLNNGGFTSGTQMNAVWPGSVTGLYNPGEPGASLTPGVQTPAVGLGPARSSGVRYNQLTPNATLGFAGQTLQAPLFPEYYTRAAAPPAVGLGLNNGGFTSGAQMNAVWPRSVTGGYNPGEPGASLTPGVQTPAVGLGPARSSGVGYNQLTPNATLGFAGQTLQAPLFPEYDTQAAAPPPTLDQLLFPPSLATAANNDYTEDYFLPPAVSDNFMHMLDQTV